jgi:hypothetical protein
MQIKWTESALLDVGRLHDFLALLNAPAAAKVVQMLTAVPTAFYLIRFLDGV